jgi:hypothetical protein
MVDIGRHHVEIEEPDIVFIVFDGDVQAEHITIMYDMAEAHVRERGLKRIFVLQDFSRIGVLSESVRQAMAHDPRANLLAALGSFGASFHVRVLINLVQRVVRIFNGKAAPVVFFATEGEARAWLEEQRHRWNAEA